MGRVILVMLLGLLTGSCASLNPLDIINPDKPSLEVNAQVGKNNEQEKSNIKVESGKKEVRQEAERISNDKIYAADKIENVIQGMSLIEFLIVLCLAGVALPNWKDLYIGVKTVIGDVWGAVVVTPAKAVYSLFRR